MKRKRHTQEIFDLIDKQRHEEVKQRLLPDCRDLMGRNWPLLPCASLFGWSDIVEYLLNKGTDIEQTVDKRTPLDAAAFNGHTDCCELLLNRGANIETKNLAPFASAAAFGHVDTCKLLLARGANINAQDQSGWTALHLTVNNRQPSTMRLLLTEDARLDIKNDFGYTPLDLAYRQELPEYVAVLENHIVNVNLSGVISRGLTDGFEFSDFLVKGICDCRLFIIVSQFAFQGFIFEKNKTQ